MTDPTPIDREAIRRRARARAEEMGLARRPEPADDGPVPEPLPTTNPSVLRALLNTGRLTPGQAAAARRMFAAARQHATDHPESAA